MTNESFGGDGLNLPLACALPEPEIGRRVSAIRDGLARRIEATEESDRGVAFRLALSDEALAEVEDFVAFERRCCAFAEFTVRKDAPNDALWLEIRGPEGTKALFRQLMLPSGPGSRRPGTRESPEPRS